MTVGDCSNSVVASLVPVTRANQRQWLQCDALLLHSKANMDQSSQWLAAFGATVPSLSGALSFLSYHLYFLRFNGFL